MIHYLELIYWHACDACLFCNMLTHAIKGRYICLFPLLSFRQVLRPSLELQIRCFQAFWEKVYCTHQCFDRLGQPRTGGRKYVIHAYLKSDEWAHARFAGFVAAFLKYLKTHSKRFRMIPQVPGANSILNLTIFKPLKTSKMFNEKKSFQVWISTKKSWCFFFPFSIYWNLYHCNSGKRIP